MRTVNLIQFTNPPDSAYGYDPDENYFYRVQNLEDTYYYETEADDGETYEETLESISIMVTGTISRRSTRHVINNDDVTYNLLTIELEDDSDLFK